MLQRNLQLIWLGVVRNLSFNTVELVPEMFAGLTSLTTLALAGNEIGYPSFDIFAGLTSLTYLDMSDNFIVWLESDTFAELANLTYL
eukprot:m.288943 g.288943  ORF g.288943 m.288943 type:complete len:87 (+) comp55060_c0_seq6:42-302(+)